MAYACTTVLDRAIESCEEIKIHSSVDDRGFGYESFTCNIINRDKYEMYVYIGIDHLRDRITLGKSPDIFVILNGDTTTLGHLNVETSDGRKLGVLYQNALISDISDTAILECLALPADASDEAIIRDPRNKAILAYLSASKPVNLSEVTTVRYELTRCLNVATKILIFLLAFKTFKTRASPEIIIPPITYRPLDGLIRIRSISIYKSSYKRQHNLEYSYFNVVDITTKQCMLTIEVFSNGCNDFRMTVSSRNGRTLFSAEPLVRFSRTTKVFGEETTEIGETCGYGMLAKTPIGKDVQLKTHGTKLPNSPDSYHKVFRHLTNHEIATITPDDSTFPRQVVMHIHPAVDTTHKALLITFAVKLIFNFYLFYKDVVNTKRSSPEELTVNAAPKKLKLTNVLSAESIENSSTFSAQPCQSISTGEGINGGGRQHPLLAYVPPACAAPAPANITSSQPLFPSSLTYHRSK